MRERRPIDDSLRGIVVDGDALDLVEEDVAVPDALAQTPRRASLLKRDLHAVFAQWVCTRPLGGLTVRAARKPRLKCRLATESGEYLRSTSRVVACSDQVPEAQLIRLILLLSREAKEVELCAGLEVVSERAAAEDRAEDLSEPPIGAALGLSLPHMRVIGRDMPHLVA